MTEKWQGLGRRPRRAETQARPSEIAVQALSQSERELSRLADRQSDLDNQAAVARVRSSDRAMVQVHCASRD